jgi:hypothetical protein
MQIELGKVLVFIGGAIAAVGGILWLGGDALKHIPLGRLPGDILIQNDRVTFYFPLTTGILLSLGVSGIIWLIRYVSR